MSFLFSIHKSQLNLNFRRTTNTEKYEPFSCNILTLKKYSLFVWNSKSLGRPVSYPATLPESQFLIWRIGRAGLPYGAGKGREMREGARSPNWPQGQPAHVRSLLVVCFLSPPGAYHLCPTCPCGSWFTLRRFSLEAERWAGSFTGNQRHFGGPLSLPVSPPQPRVLSLLSLLSPLSALGSLPI